MPSYKQAGGRAALDNEIEAIDRQIDILERTAVNDGNNDAILNKQLWELGHKRRRLNERRNTTTTGPASYQDEAFFEEEFLCKTKGQCLRDYGKEDIENEIRRRLAPEEMVDSSTGKRTTFYTKLESGKLTKKQLVDYLMKQNKRILQRLALQERDVGVDGKYKQSFPSQVSQPTMYDARGRLRGEFLTEDHQGLTFFDEIENKNFRVTVNPITRKAVWEQVKERDFAGLMIKGIRYRKDKLGRPDLRQLNYEEHHGRVVKDNKGKIHQVHCVKKDKSEPWEHPENCKRDSKGKIILEYGPYDPNMQKGSKVEGYQGEFATPLGKFNYKELMDMSLDKILQMLIVLELLDREGDYKNKVDELRTRGVILPGEEKYYQKYYPGEMGARVPPGDDQMMVRFKKMRSEVANTTEAELQEQAFMRAGLKRCRSPLSERCFNETGSYYSGVCVRPPKTGEQSKCFKRNAKWIEDYNNSRYAEALGEAATDWSTMTLKEAEELSKKRRNDKLRILREAREGTKGEKALEEEHEQLARDVIELGEKIKKATGNEKVALERELVVKGQQLKDIRQRRAHNLAEMPQEERVAAEARLQQRQDKAR